jgi:hypothetical protein
MTILAHNGLKSSAAKIKIGLPVEPPQWTDDPYPFDNAYVLDDQKTKPAIEAREAENV